MGTKTRCGGVHLKFQHSENRGRQISVNLRPTWSTEGVVQTSMELYSETLPQYIEQKKKKGVEGEEEVEEEEEDKKKCINPFTL